MPELIPYLTHNEIQTAVKEVAQRVSTDYHPRELILISVLKGSVMFLADFARQLTIPTQIDFVGATSYGNDTASSGEIHLTKKIGIDIKNKDVLVIEDIVDTGITLIYLIEYLAGFKPKSLKVCTLLDKFERRQADIKVDYACHQVNEGFLVGYGLDYAERYRNLPDIYTLKL